MDFFANIVAALPKPGIDPALAKLAHSWFVTRRCWSPWCAGLRGGCRCVSARSGSELYSRAARKKALKKRKIVPLGEGCTDRGVDARTEISLLSPPHVAEARGCMGEV